jgi:hypothetical protein
MEKNNNEVGKCQLRAYSILHRHRVGTRPSKSARQLVCHRRRLRIHMKHWTLESVSADGAVSHLRRHCLAREGETGKGWLKRGDK